MEGRLHAANFAVARDADELFGEADDEFRPAAHIEITGLVETVQQR
jgi:hypothetical protein